MLDMDSEAYFMFLLLLNDITCFFTDVSILPASGYAIDAHTTALFQSGNTFASFSYLLIFLDIYANVFMLFNVMKTALQILKVSISDCT